MARTVSADRLVDGLDGSNDAKKRLKAILATLTGVQGIGQAAEAIGIGEQRLHQIRQEALQGALEELEPGSSGRPAKAASAEEGEIAALQAEIVRLRIEVAAARVREEIAVAMPHLLVRGKRGSAKKAEAVGAGEAPVATAEPVGKTKGHEERHRARLAEACRLRGLEKKPRCARGLTMQHDQRRNERETRKAAMAFSRWAGRRLGSECEAARRLGIAPATLRQWRVDWKDPKKRKPNRRGPRERRPDGLTRMALLVVFYIMGPGVGVPTVQELFPRVPRAAIENLLRRYRKMSSRRRRRMMRSLLWRHPGTVWAMDYTEAPTPIDGTYRWCLAVRDLGSGKLLCALPVPNATADATCAALIELFRRYGAPLVIKSDNGSHFTGQLVVDLLREYGVVPLLSPPGLPEYNGAMEAGIGSLKTRAHHLSVHFGRPGAWTCDDIEGARLQANATGRPRGLIATTPDEAWATRVSVTPGDRATFAIMKGRMLDRVRFEQGYLPGLELDEKTQRALERMSVVRALIECGYLEIRRSRIPLVETSAA